MSKGFRVFLTDGSSYDFHPANPNESLEEFTRGIYKANVQTAYGKIAIATQHIVRIQVIE